MKHGTPHVKVSRPGTGAWAEQTRSPEEQPRESEGKAGAVVSCAAGRAGLDPPERGFFAREKEGTAGYLLSAVLPGRNSTCRGLNELAAGGGGMISNVWMGRRCVFCPRHGGSCKRGRVILIRGCGILGPVLRSGTLTDGRCGRPQSIRAAGCDVPGRALADPGLVLGIAE